MAVINSIAAMQPEMAAWRRDIHAHPELGFQEHRTAALVAEKLAAWGIEVTTGIAGTGVVGTLRGASPDGPVIGLRADMDALPIQETTGKPYASTSPGVMHACGHDGHTAMLLGAAKYLAETRNFAGTVHFIFQPAEEGLGGGKVMVEEGLFDRFPCDRVFGLHNWPQLEAGKMAVRPGPIMAAADQFDIRVSGRGGHGAMPHLAVDPIVIGSQIVSALQSLVSRTADPLRSAVVSVTRFQSGTTYNVIPGEALLSGTVRTFDPELQDRIEAGIARIASGIAESLGARATVEYRRGYPVTRNAPAETELLAAAAEELVGAENVVRDLDPVMGAEDFAFMLDQRPGAYLWLGQSRGPDEVQVHNAGYDFNDAVLPTGASLFARLVERLAPR